MTKTNIASGREFKFGSLPCIVLEAFEDDTVLVLAKESIGDYAFDKDNCNNFNKSSLRQFLNDDFLETLEEGGADLDSMLDFTIDLTSEDGLKDYGESTNRVALLTCDMYRKYRSIIPIHDNWWLATAYSTENNGFAAYAHNVSTDGSLDYNCAYVDGIGVRPAFLLKSSIFESCHPDLAAFTTEELNRIYNEDCLEKMKRIPDNTIDLTVTSPPYDNLRIYNGNIAQWSFEKFQDIAKELYRVTKQGGVVVWVVGDATIKGSETGTSFKQALYFKEIGFNLHDTMIWQKTNPMPKVKTKRYFDVFEYMFIFSKGVPKTFSPIMVDCKMGGKIYDSTCRNMGGENGRTKKTFVLNKQRYKNNIWGIAIAQNKTKHPAVFPEQLAQDHIISWSNEGDIVLDPFIGSGTTAIACINTNRNYIGFEIDKHYCDIANERVQKALAEKEGTV